MTIIRALRWVLSIVLLWIVWQHAHWSVTTCVTLGMINEEMSAAVSRGHRDAIVKLNQALITLSRRLELERETFEQHVERK